jgi:hypothetical protein
MKVVIDENVFPPRKHYVDIDTKFTNFTPKCRVLPANYFNEPNTLFTLKAKYEPGENKFFPKGGFEIVHVEGGTYNYELDEVIVHPFQLGMRKFFTKSETVVKEKVTDPNKKGKRGRPKIDPALKKTLPTYVPTGGKRGRKPLDPAVKAAKEAAKLAKQKVSNGKRGRPKKQIV